MTAPLPDRPAYVRTVTNAGWPREEWTMTGGPYLANIRLTQTEFGWSTRFAWLLPTRETALRTAVARLIRAVRRYPPTVPYDRRAVIDWALGVAGKDVLLPTHNLAPATTVGQMAHATENMHDDACRAIVAKAPGAAVAWLLMAGYAYHHLDHPILSDGAWDRLCRHIAQDWDALSHPHKALFSLADLECGSLYALPADRYPSITVAAVQRLIAEGVVMTTIRPTTIRPSTERHRPPKPSRQPRRDATEQLSLF